MKKLILTLSIILLFVACVLFVGCDKGNTTVFNNSTYSVTIEFGGQTITLKTNETTSIDYDNVKVRIMHPDKRVTQKYVNVNDVSIIDLPSNKVFVENKSSEIITLKANGWLENDMVDIIIGDFMNHDSQIGRIYTKSPKFTVEGNLFPVVINYQFINDICYVKLY